MREPRARALLHAQPPHAQLAHAKVYQPRNPSAGEAFARSDWSCRDLARPILRLGDAAIIDGAMIAAVELSSACHLWVRRTERCKLIAGHCPTGSPSFLA